MLPAYYDTADAAAVFGTSRVRAVNPAWLIALDRRKHAYVLLGPGPSGWEPMQWVCDATGRFLAANEIEAKVHYPKPLHLQPAMSGMYAPGSYPVAEMLAQKIISLPAHEFLAPAQIEFVNSKVREFYKTA